MYVMGIQATQKEAADGLAFPVARGFQSFLGRTHPVTQERAHHETVVRILHIPY